MNKYYCFGSDDNNLYIIEADNTFQAQLAVCKYGEYIIGTQIIEELDKLPHPVSEYIHVNVVNLKYEG